MIEYTATLKMTILSNCNPGCICGAIVGGMIGAPLDWGPAIFFTMEGIMIGTILHDNAHKIIK